MIRCVPPNTAPALQPLESVSSPQSAPPGNRCARAAKTWRRRWPGVPPAGRGSLGSPSPRQGPRNGPGNPPEPTRTRAKASEGRERAMNRKWGTDGTRDSETEMDDRGIRRGRKSRILCATRRGRRPEGGAGQSYRAETKQYDRELPRERKKRELLVDWPSLHGRPRGGTIRGSYAYPPGEGEAMPP